MVIEIIKFLIYSFLIVIISKYFLVRLLRKLAEALNLSPQTIGNITGMATSVPELLTICFSSSAGLTGVSVYNVISSNVINFIQYIIVIAISKNYNEIRNKAIKIDLFLAISTIIFPIILINLNIDLQPSIIPFFILLFIMFYYINTNAHNLYIQKNNIKSIESNSSDKNTFKAIRYSFYILITTIILFLVGTLLSNSLRNLALIFNIKESLLGIILGFVTSIPELITFLESQKHYNKKEKEEGVIEATTNLLTSNILNLFIIQSVGIIIFTIIK